MVDDGKGLTPRKPRADAQRNRALLLKTAKAAFAEKGAAASLDEIARTAGVGAGTLYRHFPTRDGLIEAVYRHETEQLVTAAARLAETHAPTAALREWLRLFVDYMPPSTACMTHSIRSSAARPSSIRLPRSK